jgi:hypothetical protein
MADEAKRNAFKAKQIDEKTDQKAFGVNQKAFGIKQIDARPY